MRLAFCAKMRSGKDESFKYLNSKYPDAINLKFAEPIYTLQTIFYDLCGFPRVEKNREFLQTVGTMARNIDKNVWTNYLKRAVLASPKNSDLFVTDARYLNEFQLLKSLNFKLIKIERPEEQRIHAGAVLQDHESEMDIDRYSDYDYVLYNDKDIVTLHNRIDTIISDIYYKDNIDNINLMNI